MNPAEQLRRAGGCGSAAPRRRGGREAARRRRLGEDPAAGTREAASSGWQSSCRNSMFRNSSGVARRRAKKGARGTRGQPALALHSLGRGPVPPGPRRSLEGRDGRVPGPFFCVCHSLYLKEMSKPVSFTDFSRESKAAFLGTLISG